MLKIELKPWDIWDRPALLAKNISGKEVLALSELEAVAKRLGSASSTESAEPPDGHERWDRPVTVISYPFGEPLEIQIK